VLAARDVDPDRLAVRQARLGLVEQPPVSGAERIQHRADDVPGVPDPVVVGRSYTNTRRPASIWFAASPDRPRGDGSGFRHRQSRAALRDA
jgi:hypothetical protein